MASMPVAGPSQRTGAATGSSACCRFGYIDRRQLLSPANVDYSIYEDSGQPVSQARAWLELAELLPRTNKSVLHDIFGKRVVAGNSVRRPEHGCRVQTNDHVEFSSVTSPALFDCLAFETILKCFVHRLVTRLKLMFEGTLSHQRFRPSLSKTSRESKPFPIQIQTLIFRLKQRDLRRYGEQ